jgi:MFS family permease
MSPDTGSRQPTRRLQPGQAAAIWGVVAAGWAVFVLPLFFGAVGVALGGYAWWRGERRGRWIIIAAIVATLCGLAIGLLPDKFVSN